MNSIDSISCITFSRINLVFTFLLFSCACSQAFGQQSEQLAAGVSQNQSVKTLDELKSIGRKQSRFHQARAVTSLGQQSFEIPQPRLAEFQATIGPILNNACLDCHGPSEQQANIRVDELDPNLHAGKDVDWWKEVFSVVSKGEMPPPDSTDLSDEDRKRIVDWLSSELQAASLVRRQSAKSNAFRRMTRYEYNYAMQDLLGLPWDFAKDLPPEPNSEEGFQNSSEQLQMTVSQFETHHRLARKALSRAISVGEKPKPLYWGISMQDASKVVWAKREKEIASKKESLKDQPEKLQAELDQLQKSLFEVPGRSYFEDLRDQRKIVAAWEYDGAKYALTPSVQPIAKPQSLDYRAVIPAGQWMNFELGDQLPDEGTLRVKVHASRTNPNSPQLPSLQLHFGWQASNEGRALLRVSQDDTVIANSVDSPTTYTWDVPLGEIYPRNSVRGESPMGALPSPSEYIRLTNSSASPESISIHYVEVQAPVSDQWPTPSHERIFGKNDSADSAASDEMAEARTVIAQFMTKAWRRPASPEDCDQKLNLFTKLRPECDSFEEAVAEVLATIVSSPKFLYIVQEVNKPDKSEPWRDQLQADRPKVSPQELATRLAIFLWCSIPDEELLEVATNGQLLDDQILSKQVIRMLADKRSKRFSQHFVHQWLNLELLEFTNFKRRNFDPLLKEAMQYEPVAMFDEVLKNNESVLNFIHADYAMCNERLARHYGINNVYGNSFQRVPLDGGFQRGGLLTQAGMLSMNSDFPDSHPLKRGKWLLISMLNDPPPPPPPAVPQIDLANPEIAKMTLKERIEDHRNHAACMACHVKIDPWGIAFENYDAVGKWRDKVNDKPVDAASELFNHQTLDGMNGLKRFLLEHRQDQFVSALVHKVTTYALGRTLKFEDQADLEAITAIVRQQGDGLGTLLLTIATSDLMKSK
jgi:Protein of unknown function (DUF1592)/Protein of unknown function (DUF1588)/Protein of unknown function (DUF1585)/Protein of unknown function (DUF1595)/Protein of unknown function (DUF1587)/Planctomycete cytochrome C